MSADEQIGFGDELAHLEGEPFHCNRCAELVPFESLDLHEYEDFEEKIVKVYCCPNCGCSHTREAVLNQNLVTESLHYDLIDRIAEFWGD